MYKPLGVIFLLLGPTALAESERPVFIEGRLASAEEVFARTLSNTEQNCSEARPQLKKYLKEMAFYVANSSRHRFVTVDRQAIFSRTGEKGNVKSEQVGGAAHPDVIKLNLFADVVLDIEIERAEHHPSEGMWTFWGRITNEPNPDQAVNRTILFVTEDGRVTASNIHHQGLTYRVYPMEPGKQSTAGEAYRVSTHLIVQIEPGALRHKPGSDVTVIDAEGRKALEQRLKRLRENPAEQLAEYVEFLEGSDELTLSEKQEKIHAMQVHLGLE